MDGRLVCCCSILVLPHAAATRGHVPLMGLSHDRTVCCEGLPDLPGAPQGYGRPTSNTLLSRFAPARRPDQCEGQLGSYPSRHTLCGGVCPQAVTRRGNSRRSRAVTPSRCMPDGSDISDEDRDLDPDPDLLIFVPACRGLVPVLVSS